jgi:hypothetical protein
VKHSGSRPRLMWIATINSCFFSSTMQAKWERNEGQNCNFTIFNWHFQIKRGRPTQLPISKNSQPSCLLKYSICGEDMACFFFTLFFSLLTSVFAPNLTKFSCIHYFVFVLILILIILIVIYIHYFVFVLILILIILIVIYIEFYVDEFCFQFHPWVFYSSNFYIQFSPHSFNCFFYIIFLILFQFCPSIFYFI